MIHQSSFIISGAEHGVHAWTGLTLLEEKVPGSTCDLKCTTHSDNHLKNQNFDRGSGCTHRAWAEKSHKGEGMAEVGSGRDKWSLVPGQLSSLMHSQTDPADQTTKSSKASDNRVKVLSTFRIGSAPIVHCYIGMRAPSFLP